MSPSTMDINHEEVLSNINYLLDNDQTNFVQNILADLHAADIADLVERLEARNRLKVMSLLDAEIASEVLTELEETLREDILKELDSTRIAELVSEMDSDDATDVVLELSSEKATEVLAQVEEESSEEIQELLSYAEDSAGGLMAKEYIAINAEWNVDEAIREIRNKNEEVEEIYQCYVVDDDGKLLGFITLKELILARPYSLTRQIMDEDVFAIRSDIDQEEVANIFEKYDLVSAPVVDENNRLIGRITIDDVIDVINEETDEDMSRIAGTGDEEILEESIFRIAQARLPWLIISFFGEIVSGFILESYDATIQMLVASAIFIPVVMAMGGSTGQQSSIIVVRGLATGEINPLDLRRRIWREVRTAMVTGLVIATLMFTVEYFWHGNASFALVLSGTLMIVIFNASMFGTIIPFSLKKVNIDPALATGPFVATFNDVIGLLIYFTLLNLSLSNGLIN